MRPELQFERGLLSPKQFKLGYMACPRCNTAKPMEKFHRSKHRVSGRLTICGECRSAMARAWRKAQKIPIAKDAVQLDTQAVSSKRKRGRVWE